MFLVKTWFHVTPGHFAFPAYKTFLSQSNTVLKFVPLTIKQHFVLKPLIQT